MKTQIIGITLLAAFGFAACVEDRPRSRKDDDDEIAEGGADPTGSGAGGATSSGAGGAMEDPQGPHFLTFGTNRTTIYEGDSLTFTAVLTDPDGVADVVGGTLKDNNGASYGAFYAIGAQGSFQLDIDWYQINEVQGIDFAYGAQASRVFVAEFFDAAGHVSTTEVTIELTCSSGYAGCDGSCIDTMNDSYACGSCTKSCYDDLCVYNAFCSQGQCAGEVNTCDWLDDQCVVGQCNPSSGDCNEQAAPNNTACDDGDPCTTNDKCTAGVCAGSGSAGGILLQEDFSDNLAGWTLGTEWGIGPAMASSGQSSLNPDPSLDHSPTADNGVAGVVIGGNASVAATHAYYYLTSPAVDASAAQGTLTLELYRWLNSDYTPYMQNAIEVWNGSAWVKVWESAATATSDASWTLVSYDITAYKNAALKVRFGHALLSTSAYTASSWNIDDVLISGAACGQ